MGFRDQQVFNLYGESKFQGNLEGPLFPSMGIGLLKAALGTDTLTGTAAPYTHTINEANTLDSLTIEKNIGGFQSQQFAGCKVNKYTLKVTSGNEAAHVTADVVGQSVTVLNTPTAQNFVNEAPFVFAEASLNLFGNTRAEAKNFTLDIENGLKESYTFSQQHGPNFITPVNLRVNGSFDVVWSSLNDPVYGDFMSMINGNQGALSLTLAHPGASGYSVQFTLPQVVLAKDKHDLKVADTVLSTLEFEASRPLSGTNQYTIQAVAKNGVNTAY